MKKTIFCTAAVAVLASTACRDNSNLSQDDAAAGEDEVAVEEIELPPSIKDSKPYRCTGGDIVYIDYFSDGRTASIRTEKHGQATMVRLPEPEPVEEGEAAPETPPVTSTEFDGTMTSEDGTYALEVNGEDIELTMPEKGTRTCKG